MIISRLLVKTFLLLSLLEKINCESSNVDDYYQVPSITLSNLRNKGDRETIANALGNTGIISVTDINEGFVITRNNALKGLCKCASNRNIVDIDNSESFTLKDGVTTRTSIATLTSMNGMPLALNGDQIDSVCPTNTSVEKLSNSMEKLRDYVHLVSKEFVSALDDIIGAHWKDDNVLMETSHGKTYDSVHGIVQDATHLEHFHVYSKQTKNDKDIETSTLLRKNTVLETHTDAGLFLSFLPSMPCNDDNEDSSFMISVDGKLRKAKFPSANNSVVMMLGIGAQNWLQNVDTGGKQSPKLVATKHAVQMNNGSIRSWYGTMHLVPEKAIIERKSSTTFAEMRSSMIVRDPKDIINHNNDKNEALAIGCGHSSRQNDMQLATKQSSFGRRLQTHVDASVCNNETNFYCWMSCIDVPDSDSAQDLVSNGETLYCADATILDQGIEAAVNSCSDVKTGEPGGAMNTNCIGVWHTVDEDVPSQTLNGVDYSVMTSDAITSSNSMVEFNEYCYGGTSMYMNGFQWEGIYCVIYLFPSWVLNTPWKLLVACLGTVLTGIALEGIITARRMILLSKRFTKQDRNKKLFISMLLYGAQLSLGYLIMLVVMTYSGPLFISVVAGLMIGHVLFQVIVPPKSSTSTKDSKQSASVIIEGATPCCQYRVSEEDAVCFDDNDKNNQASTEGMTDELTYDDYNPCHCSATTPNEVKKGEKEFVFSDASNQVEEPESCCGGKVNGIEEDGSVEINVTSDVESSPVQVFSSCCGGDGHE